MWMSSILSVLVTFHGLCTLKIIDAKPFEEKITLRLYKKNSTIFEEAVISQGETLFQESKGYNHTLPIVLLIHGIATGADCYFVNGLIEAFVERQLTDDYNIFAVDMPEILENSFRNEYYIGILANVKPAGEKIGELLSRVVSFNLTSPDRISIIGYSMGAQVAGYAARVVKNRIGEINFIAALDPAGPGFHIRQDGKVALTHVSAADARVTHFYHTNSFLCGTRSRIATADFVFNQGNVQPGCTKDKGLDCSHVRVPYLYIEAVNNTNSFVARRCSSWDDFKTCYCNHNDTVFITFPPDYSAKGLYFLRTRGESPFALGKRGSRCRRIVHSMIKRDKPDSHSNIASSIAHMKELFHPKIKESIKMHLIKGIKNMEARHAHEMYEQSLKQLDQSNEKASETHGVTDDIQKEETKRSHIG